MSVPFQAYNVIAPYRNTSGLSSQAAVVINQAGVNINLSDYFGGVAAGHFFTFIADGATVYIQIAPDAGGAALDEQAQGGGVNVCWPIPNGQQLPMRILGGRQVGTGYGTQIPYASGVIVRAKLAISGAATGFLRIYRSSVDETQGVGQLKPPGWR
jgi:hypothetical protein